MLTSIPNPDQQDNPRILVIDAGTTGIRSLIYDDQAQVLSMAYTEFPQYHPAPDRVEEDANEIWEATIDVIGQSLEKAKLLPGQITAIGITNQRATTVLWDRTTGEPVAPAIVWQDTRTADRAEELKDKMGKEIYSRIGWEIAPVYSSLSIEWILNHNPDIKKMALEGQLAFGTIDSWLIYKLTGGKTHVISASNASVSGSYDLSTNSWHTDWLKYLQIPENIYPTVCDDSGLIALTDKHVFGASVPIASAIADQHSALFAQGCINPGMTKCTHGTGTFLDMNIGPVPVIDTDSGLTCQIAWRIGGKDTYSLEGYAGSTGAAIQWLRDGLEIIESSADSEVEAEKVENTDSVYFVPALTGLSAPYWDAYARGMIIGIAPGTKRAHIVRAALEGIVFSVRDFMDVMAEISGHPISTMAVDGGAARNNLLLQMQADQLNAEVVRPTNTEATSLGAALLAGLATGVWKNPTEAVSVIDVDASFNPSITNEERQSAYETWKQAVERSRNWLRK